MPIVFAWHSHKCVSGLPRPQCFWPSKIPQVVSIEWGTNVSPEKFDKGFTHGFIVTFNSDKDRDACLVHPEHKKFVDFALPSIDDVFVLDFWGKK